MLSTHRGLYLLLLPQKCGTALSSICHPNLTKLKHNSKQFSLLLCFRMGKTFDCNKCGGHHRRPINRTCKLEKNKDEPMDMNSQILKELKKFKGSYVNCSRLRRQINRCNHILNRNKGCFYRDLVSENCGDSKRLWHALNRTLSWSNSTVLPSFEDEKSLANRFGSFSIDKIRKI